MIARILPTEPRDMQALLAKNESDIALVIGNGINRYNAPAGTNSWDALLTTLARKHLDPGHAGVPDGMSPTEFYDILELAIENKGESSRLQSDFCELMEDWTSLPQHGHIVGWALSHAVPVLTTNFENTLGQACSAKLQRCGKSGGFTAFYPWSRCYSTKPVVDPLKEFAIWHLNGMQRYRQSIRLGLSHYMGSVERARSWFQRSGTRLFGATDITAWPGSNTWLQVFLHKPLVFFGLNMGENEVFLRWLLIERARYYVKFPKRRQQAWYAYVVSDIEPGKELFLKGVGVDPYPVRDYRSLYGPATWSTTPAA